jgi:hypothetical protein
VTAAAILRRAAAAYRDGETGWGRLFFHKNGQRCAAGAVCYAVDPEYTNSDPRFCDNQAAAMQALQTLALYLVDNGLAAEAFTDGMFDPVETVAEWNDWPGRVVDDVIAALEAAAAIAERVAVSA